MKERGSGQQQTQTELYPKQGDGAYEGVLVELRLLRERVSGFPTIPQIAAVYLLIAALGLMIVAFAGELTASERQAAERRAEHGAYLAQQEERLHEVVERLDRALAKFD